MQLKSWLKLLLLCILIGGISFALFYFRHHIDIHSLQNQLSAMGWWAPLAFILIYIGAVVFFLPGSIFTLAGGLIFGALWGTIYNLIAAVVGASIAFLLARYVAGDWVKKKAGGRITALLKGVEEEGWKFIAVVRLVPIFPFNLLNYALGVTPMPFVTFFLGSALFMLPGTFAYTYVGALGQTAIGGDAQTIATQILLAIGLFVLISLIPWWWNKKRQRGDS